jgi:hypothetical protein
MSDTVGVTYEVLQVEQVRDSGRMVAVATVEVTIAGVAVVMQGVRVTRRADGTLECLSPAGATHVAANGCRALYWRRSFPPELPMKC